MTTDLSGTIAPKSDQLDAVDLLGGPRTFTVTNVVVKPKDEQPVTIFLAEFDRPWKPGLSMRRVLLSCWGSEGATYVGRRIRLYCDKDVAFGGVAVGGTRIEAMSDIKGTQKVPLLMGQRKSAVHTVKPLADEPPAKDWPAIVQAATTRDHLVAIRKNAAAAKVPSSVIDPLLTARAAELEANRAAE